MSFYVSGTGFALPSKVVTNNDLATFIDTSDEWISQRTGIKERRILTSESLTDLTYISGQDALKSANLTPADIDLVIGITIRGDFSTPSQACVTAEKLGIIAPCFDVNAACTGVIYGMDIADSFIATGKAKNVLLITCEAMSKVTDWQERATCVLFGDGAAAMVLSAGDGLKSCLIKCVPNTHAIHAQNHKGDSPMDTSGLVDTYLRMDGQEVYKFAVNAMISAMEQALVKANLTIEDIAYVLPHQANLRIIDAAKKRFGIPDQKVLININKYGNMSATSLGVLLCENAQNGVFKKGDKLLLVAFGAGLTYGACVVEWK